MNFHLVRLAVGFGSLSLCFCVVAGCGPKSDTTEAYDLPEVEPTVADRADTDAVKRYQSLRNGGMAKPTDVTQWPQLFGPARTSVAPEQDLDLAWESAGPKELWSIEVGTGYGSPVISGERVVFNHRVGEEEIVQCVRAEDGGPIWQHRYATTFKCEVEYSDGPYSTPVIEGDRVFAVGGQGQMFCLQLESGDVIWKRLLHEEYGVEDGLFPVGSSPLIAEGRLIFNLGAIEQDAGIIALDASDGTEIWRSSDHPAGYCSPFAATIHGQKFLFVITNRGLVSLEPSTGKMDWMVTHYSRAPMSYNAVSPLVIDDKVLIVTGPGPGAVCVRVNPDRTHTE
ncbi:MAG: PQQ-binding-like beta-propeller repeat protein, partial [Verrucomicrobiota bacterium]